MRPQPEAVGRYYVYTHKPHPTVVSMVGWHPDIVRAELRKALEATREHVLEVNFQDLHTVRDEPHRLGAWTQIAMELEDVYA